MVESVQNGPLGDMLDRLRTIGTQPLADAEALLRSLTDFLNDGVENEHRVGNLRLLSDTLEMVANLRPFARPRFHAAQDELEEMFDYDGYYDNDHDHDNDDDDDDDDEYYTTEEEMDYDTVD
ncbi:hypothetical protein HDU99_006952 [Rhizoclosmatium hyalinum]|nr:hypothetical protein HDU99_006952 [Rhizoclosmatium hyalinum]